MQPHLLALGRLAAEDDGPSPLLPHLSELIVGIVAFVLLFLFLRARVFPMFEKAYAERTNAIQGGMERAEQAEREAREALEQYRAQLGDARQEAARLREEARAQGTTIVAELREQAQAEAARIVAGAHAQIASDRQSAFNELRGQVGDIAIDLSERIVGESLRDRDLQSRVVDRFLAELESGTATTTAASPSSRTASGSSSITAAPQTER